MKNRKLIISMSILAALSAVALQPVVAAPSADDVVAKPRCVVSSIEAA
jgi:hypothetical protein